MVSLPIRLGYKYFRSKKGALISLTSGIAIAALAIAVSVLIIVSSVMNGLEKELALKVLKTAAYKLPIKTKIVTRALPRPSFLCGLPKI